MTSINFEDVNFVNKDFADRTNGSEGNTPNENNIISVELLSSLQNYFSCRHVSALSWSWWSLSDVALTIRLFPRWKAANLHKDLAGFEFARSYWINSSRGNILTVAFIHVYVTLTLQKSFRCRLFELLNFFGNVQKWLKFND